jgi:hypothetical protein
MYLNIPAILPVQSRSPRQHSKQQAIAVKQKTVVTGKVRWYLQGSRYVKVQKVVRSFDLRSTQLFYSEQPRKPRTMRRTQEGELKLSWSFQRQGSYCAKPSVVFVEDSFIRQWEPFLRRQLQRVLQANRKRRIDDVYYRYLSMAISLALLWTIYFEMRYI